MSLTDSKMLCDDWLLDSKTQVGICQAYYVAMMTGRLSNFNLKKRIWKQHASSHWLLLKRIYPTVESVAPLQPAASVIGCEVCPTVWDSLWASLCVMLFIPHSILPTHLPPFVRPSVFKLVDPIYQANWSAVKLILFKLIGRMLIASCYSVGCESIGCHSVGCYSFRISKLLDASRIAANWKSFSWCSRISTNHQIIPSVQFVSLASNFGV